MNVFPATSLSNVTLPKNVTSVGIRPEPIAWGPPGDGQLEGTVDLLEYLGADTFVIIACGEAGQITMRVNGSTTRRPGDTASLKFSACDLHVFDHAGLALPLSQTRAGCHHAHCALIFEEARRF